MRLGLSDVRLLLVLGSSGWIQGRGPEIEVPGLGFI